MMHSIKTISKLHELLGVSPPKHPQISLLKLDGIDFSQNKDVWKHYSTSFYTIAIKQGETAKMKYGQNEFDFEEGILMCNAPKQVLSITDVSDINVKGYALVFDKEFLLNNPLSSKINEYRFFDYSNNEALFLSDDENNIVFELFKKIEREYLNNLDSFSEEVILSTLDLLLVYVNRYYSRQFITRKKYHSNLLIEVERILAKYYQNENTDSLPTVQYLADRFHLSPAYLSDLLKSYTGLSAQQHIHEVVIEKAKELLTTSELSVSQIAYELGFQHPQSFNKLFKKKTNSTPLKFRQSFN